MDQVQCSDQLRQLSLDPATTCKVGKKVKTRGMIREHNLLLAGTVREEPHRVGDVVAQA